jgi:hypothetical protein
MPFGRPHDRDRHLGICTRGTSLSSFATLPLAGQGPCGNNRREFGAKMPLGEHPMRRDRSHIMGALGVIRSSGRVDVWSQ